MITEDKVTEIFYMADDFCKFFDAMVAKYTLKPTGKRKYHRDSTMSKAEVMLIMILFHDSGYHCFKHFYLEKRCRVSMYKGLLTHNSHCSEFVELTFLYAPSQEVDLPLFFIAHESGGKTSFIQKVFSLLEESTRQRHLFNAEDLTTWHKRFFR